MGGRAPASPRRLNALFCLNRPTHNAIACPAAVEPITLAPRQLVDLWPRPVSVIDTPGHGESRVKDLEFLPAYRRAVREVDHVVWLLQADIRYYRGDQEMLRHLGPFFRPGARLTLGLNHIDRFGPGDWNVGGNCPSAAQQALLPEKVDRVVAQITKIVPVSAPDVVVYSASRGYGLGTLRSRLFPGKEIGQCSTSC